VGSITKFTMPHFANPVPNYHRKITVHSALCWKSTRQKTHLLKICLYGSENWKQWASKQDYISSVNINFRVQKKPIPIKINLDPPRCNFTFS